MSKDYLFEEWKDIKGYEGLYQVSNFGRVKRLVSDYRTTERILKPSKNKIGYYQAHLSKNNIKVHKYIHRLVYEAFVGEIPNGYELNHADEDKSNNALSNLQLVDHLTNCNYGTRNKRISTNKRKKDAA